MMTCDTLIPIKISILHDLLDAKRWCDLNVKGHWTVSPVAYWDRVRMFLFTDRADADRFKQTWGAKR